MSLRRTKGTKIKKDKSEVLETEQVPEQQNEI